MKKKLAIFLACVLLVGGIVGGTLAWLTDKTDPIVNTFTTSGIEIDLTETTGTEYKMVPGCTITKDPVVTVEGGSEACWLFVKLEKANDFGKFMTYAIADGWTLVEGQSNVYCRTVSANSVNQPFAVLKNNQVSVKDTVTKADMKTLADSGNYPKLTVTAYATQYYETNNDPFAAKEAWAKIGA